MKRHDANTVSRRAFLGAAGAAAVSPLLTSLPAAAQFNAIRVGLLLPRSNVYPQLSDNFLAGVKLALERRGNRAAGRPVALFAEDIGFGTSLANRKAKLLAADAQVDVAVAFINSDLAGSVRSALGVDGAGLIVSNAGANRPAVDSAGGATFNTLSLYQSNMAAGTWAANQLGRRAMLVSSFYDSGYDALFAFQQAFEAAGGQIVDTRISHVPPDDVNFSSIVSAIRQAEPDFVFGAYSGEAAVEFVQAYHVSRLSRTIPLVGSSFMTDEALLPLHGKAARGVRTVASWSPSLATAENKDFMTLFRKLTGRQADQFAVLGYDTAELILAAAGAAGGEGRTALSAAMDNISYAGPRGQVQIANQVADAPLYLREVQAAQRSPGSRVIQAARPGYHNGIVTQLTSGQSIPVDRPALRTGWLNAYMSI